MIIPHLALPHLCLVSLVVLCAHAAKSFTGGSGNHLAEPQWMKRTALATSHLTSSEIWIGLFHKISTDTSSVYRQLSPLLHTQKPSPHTQTLATSRELYLQRFTHIYPQVREFTLFV